MTVICLTDQEMNFARSVGRMWVELGILNGYHLHNTIEPELIYRRNEIGAAAEYAAAKVLELTWHYSDPAHRYCDIGSNTNVSHTDVLNGNLIIEDKYPLNRIFVLVISVGNNGFDVVGSINGLTDKKVWRTDLPKPAWFIHRKFLRLRQ